MENVIKDFGFCTPSYYHPEMLLLSLSQSQGGWSWGFCKATGPLLSLAFGSAGLQQPLAFQPCWFVVSPNKDHHCHGPLAMWAGGYVCIKGWLSFGLYMPFAIRLLIPLNVRLGEKKKDQIKEALRLLAVSLYFRTIEGKKCIRQPDIFPMLGPLFDNYSLLMFPTIQKPMEQKKTGARTFWPFSRIVAIQLPPGSVFGGSREKARG